MTFQPRMNNSISGFSVIGGLNRRVWNGIVADVWEVSCAPRAGGFYVAEDPRLFIVLDARGTGEITLRETRHSPAHADRRQMLSYIPAGMELWAEMVDVDYVRHLDLHFNIDILSRRLMEDLDRSLMDMPRLMFSDPRFLALAELIASECVNPKPLHDLYGDGLAIALFIDLMRLAPVSTKKRGALANWQLRRAVEHIEDNCMRSIRLEELGVITGLSSSYFSHAFKASTGLPPHQWQMKARIERAKQMIMRGNLPLSVVAGESGFADQAHFTRVFRKWTGATPANWARTRRF